MRIMPIVRVGEEKANAEGQTQVNKIDSLVRLIVDRCGACAGMFEEELEERTGCIEERHEQRQSRNTEPRRG